MDSNEDTLIDENVSPIDRLLLSTSTRKRRSSRTRVKVKMRSYKENVNRSWIERLFKAKGFYSRVDGCLELYIRDLVPSRVLRRERSLTTDPEKRIWDCFCLTENDMKTVTRLNFYLELSSVIDEIIPLLHRESCKDLLEGEHSDICLRLSQDSTRGYVFTDDSLKIILEKANMKQIVRKVLKALPLLNREVLEILADKDYSTHEDIVLLMIDVLPFVKSRYDKRDCESHFLLTIKEFCGRATTRNRNGSTKRKKRILH